MNLTTPQPSMDWASLSRIKPGDIFVFKTQKEKPIEELISSGELYMKCNSISEQNTPFSKEVFVRLSDSFEILQRTGTFYGSVINTDKVIMRDFNNFNTDNLVQLATLTSGEVVNLYIDEKNKKFLSPTYMIVTNPTESNRELISLLDLETFDVIKVHKETQMIPVTFRIRLLY